MKKMPGLRAVPLAEVRVDLFYCGAFDQARDGQVHSKICPHAIFARALQGRYEISCGDGRQADLAEGEAFLTGANLPLRIVHHCAPGSQHHMRAHWLHMHYTLFGSLDVLTLLELPLRVSARDCEAFSAIISELQGFAKVQRDELWQMVRRQELAFSTLRLLCELVPLRADADMLLHQHERLAPILHYMERHLGERLSVADLAAKACLSVPRFHAWFRQLTGRSPMAYLKQRRLSAACRLLLRGNSSLQEVAAATGFCNQFHLSRDFRQAFGKPPRRWKQEYDATLA